ncbi:hypothetical protein [Actinoplanes regularis]|uniref:hypothetical protein n=1 Tax=Actinoplanes regularis TaxID=52697 RepID=UPI0024A4926B|nr:hypothetical protein [Actinoplanes regularis]GLW34998.1 hypothetical protein Areg01_79340 [Actinoplanes regularis]
MWTTSEGRRSLGARLCAIFATTALATLAAVALETSPAAAAVGTERVSVSTGGTQGDADSAADLPNGVSSDDGRYIVFDSFATNLVAGDTNNDLDVFVRDRQAGTTERVSVSSGGAQGNSSSALSAISGDGRYVVFTSEADNLVSGDTNATGDVFLRDRQAGTTERVSLTAGGGQADGASVQPTVSDDGNRVAFLSVADDLVTGDTNDTSDAFVRDRQAGTTVRVSVSSGGAQGNDFVSLPVISGGGGQVAFTSAADNLVPSDTNGTSDVFVHILQTATTERVSVSSGGGQSADGTNGRASISDDGRYVAFDSAATDLVASDTNGAFDAFVRDRQAGTTERVNLTSGGAEANAESGLPSISDDGRYVAFPSAATNLVASDTNSVLDVFVRDRQNSTTQRVSLTNGGAEADGDSDPAFISGDGQHVAFTSSATNLVASDTNGVRDMFVRDLTADACTITGTSGNDTLTGTGGADVICGLGGNDTINALGGADTIEGGSGDDIIDGGNNSDIINGGDGADTINGGLGTDTINGGDGVDDLDGGGDGDGISGGNGNDVIDGGGGADNINGGDGTDGIDGGASDDTIDGGPGNDDLDGQGGQDTLIDHDGTDTTFGDAGNDHLDVQDGVGGDTANGGTGTDTCAADGGDTVSSC